MECAEDAAEDFRPAESADLPASLFGVSFILAELLVCLVGGCSGGLLPSCSSFSLALSLASLFARFPPVHPFATCLTGLRLEVRLS